LLLAAGATIALLLVLTVSSSDHREAAAAYVVLIGSLALLALARLIPEEAPPGLPSLFEAEDPRTQPGSLAELEQLRLRLASSQASALDFHHRLRPPLFDVARARLARGYGVDPSRDPERARALLGEAAWELLRPDRDPPRDTRERGIRLRELQSLIETLEKL
jgi:hypothetical protein